ncbi:MAG TPA: cytochrome c [Casimicrobiaceae bacterium]|nr:cytochrome c [Casimicrobiaceae bacterium]
MTAPRPVPHHRRNMLVVACAALMVGAPWPAPAAEPAPFAHADAAAGKALVERDCVACHAQKFSGDADRIYLRQDRRVHTPQQLLAQVSWCNTQLGTKYFPDDEENVAAYLNQRYYHFAP